MFNIAQNSGITPGQGVGADGGAGGAGVGSINAAASDRSSTAGNPGANKGFVRITYS
ncbi:MAG: hypothetical protein AAF402_07340 [Pseudomonadota bacterium]